LGVRIGSFGQQMERSPIIYRIATPSQAATVRGKFLFRA